MINVNEKDVRSRAFLFPKHIVWTQGQVENSQMLLVKREHQISLSAHEPCVMRSTQNNKASILLDYGTEIHGGVRILVWESTLKEAKLRIRFGESVSEAMSELGGSTNATNDHARRDMIVEVGMMSMNQIGESGFRFVRIDLEESDASISLKSVCAVLVYKDVPYRGSFQCSDELISRIWEVGAYTVHLNMQEYIWDGIKRDRLVWVGDMHPEVRAIQAVFGEDDSVQKSLDFIRKETPLPQWMNHMASYSMWYVMIVYDWFLYTGKKVFIEEQKEYLVGILNQLSAHIDEKGKDTVIEGRFLDWPSVGNEKVIDAGVQALHILATKSLQKIFSVLGDKERVEQCESDLQKLSYFAQKETDYELSKQAASLLVLAGQKSANKVNERLLKQGNSKGMSTFMGYYILSARALAGDYQGCLACIREYWGGMLKLGATTFWEDFDVEWMTNASRIDELPEDGKVDVHATYGRHCYKGYRHSLCHGWASGVTPWLSEYILGVQILEAGCKVVKIEPHLGDLDWVKGTYPTPYGEIVVSHKKRENGTIDTNVEAPKEIMIINQ